MKNEFNQMGEEKSNNPSPSRKSVTNLCLGLASLGAGAYLGYCNAQGIPFEKENLESTLTYGPVVVRGVVGAIKGGLVGLISGGGLGTVVGTNISDKISGTLVGAGTGIVVGTATGVGIGGTVGAVKGGIQTLIGYGIGYMAGYMTK